MAKLRGNLAERGVAVEYPLDRAAIDVGVHLWVDVDGAKQVVGARVWFQVKGFHDTTVARVDYDEADAITTPSMEMDHVRYWYNAPEPVYLVLYIESADAFLAADVRDLVDRRGGLAKVATSDQKTTTFKIPKTNTLEHAIAGMPRHRSMRIDGPAWRGRPLGHGIDPLRSALAPMPRELFIDIVNGILSAQDFRLTPPVETVKSHLSANSPTVLRGRMYLTYEWVLPMTTEFGFDAGTDFRIEGAPLHAQGDVLVVVDPVGDATLESIDIDAFAKAAATDRVIVMSNTLFTPAQFGQWFAGLREKGLRCEPQDLSSLTFNVLTTTNVFLDFHDRLAFDHVNYL
ncbi:MAG TPA: DUF4365 domain-containing protein [Plantibacter sp.]|uniref:DUF4365 domain-containing protein n=1 Tax=unclassified Plantibacter TaxID=2624265 RepID=UPI002C90C161|nr:DUF4365 domain-containing protein [Plantibacter sp.]